MKRHPFLKALEFTCRLGLGALFIYSALAKISDPDSFADSVSRYRMLPGFAIGLFALTMPFLELLAGLAMLFTKWLRESALLIAGMLMMFIVALAQALARGLDISCGCFGVPSVGGRSEILIALVRDLVLVVPAAWLAFRPNFRLWPLGHVPKRCRMICLWGSCALFAAWFGGDIVFSRNGTPGLSSMAEGEEDQGRGLAISSGPIRPGEWNADFSGVLAKAEREQRPMVLMHVGMGCRHCARMEDCIAGEAFRLWRKDRAPLMAFVRSNSPQYSKETTNASHDFAHGINKDINGYPYVCVFWPHDGVTNSVAFIGRRGVMGGEKHKLLVMELMSALDRALGAHDTKRFKSLDSILKEATVRISARAARFRGTVSITPESGLLAEGGKVELTASPNEGFAFLDWRRPDGSLAGLAPQLAVSAGMPIGCYTARFKRRSQCLPPMLLSPAETTLYVRVNAPARYEIKFPEACRPVSFRTNRKLPFDMKLDSATGVISGIPRIIRTNTVSVTIIGNDPQRTEKSMSLTIAVTPSIPDDEQHNDDSGAGDKTVGAAAIDRDEEPSVSQSPRSSSSIQKEL